MFKFDLFIVLDVYTQCKNNLKPKLRDFKIQTAEN